MTEDEESRLFIAKTEGRDARRIHIPFHQNPYQYSGSKLKAQKRMWDIGWHEENAIIDKDVTRKFLEDARMKK